ncbi:YybH family protein [Tundrisphaera sp. TA3]|uniref:YybH family protein n=1 Tax=Tundrisphaera sp. TA3 TaxID=3435775 RepID=UPI003EB8A333
MNWTPILVAALGCVAGLPAWAQDAPETPRREADEAAIRAISQDFARAFEKGDAAAVARFWTEEGEYIGDDGKVIRGHAAIASAYSSLFAGRTEIKAESKTDSIRFVGADTAIEEGTFHVTAKDSEPDRNRFSAVYARQGGKWLMASLRESADDTADRPTLQDLAWLVGEWEGGGDDGNAHVTYEWSPTKAFLLARFEIKPKKDESAPTAGGMQVIGVDPAEGVIRAWTFAPDGGFGAATWIRDGQGWSIESEATHADGSRTTARNRLAPEGDDAFTWSSVRRPGAGTDEPAPTSIKVRRVRDGK